MTMTMATLIEDASDKCLASGPVGMSDGVMTLEKHRKSDRRMSAVGSREPQKTLKSDNVSRCVQSSQTEKK